MRGTPYIIHYILYIIHIYMRIRTRVYMHVPSFLDKMAWKKVLVRRSSLFVSGM